MSSSRSASDQSSSGREESGNESDRGGSGTEREGSDEKGQGTYHDSGSEAGGKSDDEESSDEENASDGDDDKEDADESESKSEGAAARNTDRSDDENTDAERRSGHISNVSDSDERDKDSTRSERQQARDEGDDEDCRSRPRDSGELTALTDSAASSAHTKGHSEGSNSSSNDAGETASDNDSELGKSPAGERSTGRKRDESDAAPEDDDDNEVEGHTRDESRSKSGWDSRAGSDDKNDEDSADSTANQNSDEKLSRRDSQALAGSRSPALSSRTSSRVSPESSSNDREAFEVHAPAEPAKRDDSHTSAQLRLNNSLRGEEDNSEDVSNRKQRLASARTIQRSVRNRQAKARHDREKHEQHHAATQIQANARGSRSRQEHDLRSKPYERKSSGDGRDRSLEVKSQIPGAEDAAVRCIQQRCRQAFDRGESGRLRSKRSLRDQSEQQKMQDEQDAAARRIQKGARQQFSLRKVNVQHNTLANFSKDPTEPQARGLTKSRRNTLDEDAAVRRIQKEARRRTARRLSDVTNTRHTDVDARRDSINQATHTTSTQRIADTNSYLPVLSSPDRATSTRHHHQGPSAFSNNLQRSPAAPIGWMSPGKAAAKAAAAAAAAAATAASASVRAAEAAADAAQAAETAANAEEQGQEQEPFGYSYDHGSRENKSPREGLGKGNLSNASPNRPEDQSSRSRAHHLPERFEIDARTCGGMYRSPPHARKRSSRLASDEETLHQHHLRRSPARSGMTVDLSPERARGNPQRSARGTNTDRRSTGEGEPADGVWRERMSDDGHFEEHVRRDGGVGVQSGRLGEEEMLQRAREQARRHARERRARALAKEEESKRELQAVQADLRRAEELRAKQEVAERAALEAKRARVIEDMRRRQQRLLRLQQGEGRIESHSRSPRHVRDKEPADREHEGLEVGAMSPSSVNVTGVSLPRLGGGDDVGASVSGGGGRDRGRRRPRHVSAFRDRILEERRARREVDALRKKQVEEKLGRQADYAAKIRAQAKRALAAEQCRAQDDAAHSARAAPWRGSGAVNQTTGNGVNDSRSYVDRTPVVIKKPDEQRGRYGVFTYAPDRPIVDRTNGHFSSNVSAVARSGRSYDNSSISHPAFGRRARGDIGGRGPGRGRPGTQELAERMRYERAKATNARRARAAGLVHGSTNGGDGECTAGHRGSADGDNSAIGGEEEEVLEKDTSLHAIHRPAPPSQSSTGRSANGRRRSFEGGTATHSKRDNSDCRLERGYEGEARAGGAKIRPPPGQRQSRPAGDDVHAMYEARLSALERRLGRGGSGHGGGIGPTERSLCLSTNRWSRPPGATSGTVPYIGRQVNERNIPPRENRTGLRNSTPDLTRDPRGLESANGQQAQPSDEWGPNNNPFGYRASSEGYSVGGVRDRGNGQWRQSGARIDSGSSSGGINRRGSAGSGDVEVEGLSSMYMGPIAHKMAEIRAAHG